MENRVSITNNSTIATIDPFGAELIELCLLKGENVLWKKDGIHWNRVAPNLFPIVGKLKNDTYTIEGKLHSMTQHGFARDHMFTVESRTDDSVTLMLCSNENTLTIYPFSFELRVTYTLIDSGICVQYSVKNTGQQELPFSVGGHPGFALTEDLSNYELLFPGPMTIKRHVLDGANFSGQTETMIINGTLPLSNDLFERDAIVFIEPPFNELVLANREKGSILKVSSDQWDALGIWTKKGAPFLCIEPWWGYADRNDSNGDLFKKAGIHLLESQKTEKVNFSIVLM